MYTRTYYDGLNRKMHLWERHGDKTHKFEFDHEIEYYIPDKFRESKITDIYGNPVVRAVARDKRKVYALKEQGIKLCESDLSEETKFIQKRYKDVDLKPSIKDFTVAGVDIECESDRFPFANQASYPVNLIGLRIFGQNKVYVFGTEEYTGDNPRIIYDYCESEHDLFFKFFRKFKELNIDIVTGWNVIDFDIRYIINRCKNIGVSENMSPLGIVNEDTHGNITIAGVTVWDYMLLYKEFDKTPLEHYSLDFVSNHVLGYGKIYLDGGINQAYKDNWNTFVDYNVRDVDLIVDLDEKLKLIEFAISIAYQALIPLNKVMSTIQVITGYLIKYLHKHGMVMNDRAEFLKQEYPGAWNYSNPGYYKNVESFDVESEYPHILMQFNISPETLVINPPDVMLPNLIKTPVDGVYFLRNKIGILPKITKQAFEDRKSYKQKQLICQSIESGNKTPEQVADALKFDVDLVKKKMVEIKEEGGDVFFYKGQNNIRKIIVNSIYGILGNAYFHFYSVECATAVTLGGQALIKHLSSSISKFFMTDDWKKAMKIENLDLKIEKDPLVLVDTDSCYVCMDEIFDKLSVDVSTHQKLISQSLNFYKYVFGPLFKRSLDEFADKWKVEQIINFKHEKIITQQIVLKKKRYAAEYIYSEGITYNEPQYSFTGVEVIRSSTPHFCREGLRETIQMIFDEKRLGKAKDDTMMKIVDIKNSYKKQPMEEIAFPRGINKYDKYVKPIESYLGQGLTFSFRCPAAIKAAQVYNYLISKDNLPLQPAVAGDKIRFLYVNPNNELGVETIGFIGTWPKQLEGKFEIDYDLNFEKGFVNVIREFFEMVDWGDIEFQFIDTGDAVIW